MARPDSSRNAEDVDGAEGITSTDWCNRHEMGLAVLPDNLVTLEMPDTFTTGRSPQSDQIKFGLYAAFCPPCSIRCMGFAVGSADGDRSSTGTEESRARLV